VEPHEVAAGFRVEHRAAWADATATLPATPAATPTEWVALVGLPTAVYAVPMAAGNFPQRVKDVAPLVGRFNPAALRPSAGGTPAPGLSGLRTWIVREAKKRTAAAALLAAGVARATGELDWAAELLADAEALCAGDDRARWENERAALAWQRGDAAEALARWEALPDAPVVRFNRGMALLFLGRPADARAALDAAIKALPEGSGWRDLAELYRSLAEIHG
jgi:tetratricopeptide (TPR) repeat protein